VSLVSKKKKKMGCQRNLAFFFFFFFFFLIGVVLNLSFDKFFVDAIAFSFCSYFLCFSKEENK
jgi:hypothetical protein